MAEYAKKLHVKKGSTVTDIKLYSTIGEVGSNYVTLKDGSNLMYAKLGATSDALASPLNIKKGSTTYKVLKSAVPPYAKVTYTTPGTFTFTAPQGITKVKVTVAGAGGGNGQTGAGSTYKAGAGGQGALVIKTITVETGTTYTIKVGHGGQGGVDKTAGGSSSFDTVTAQGGDAGGDSSEKHPGLSAPKLGDGGLGGGPSKSPKDGENGWVYVEYGQGIE